MNLRHKRRVYTILRLLESQVLDLINERREDAGEVALRCMDRDNQDAAADRDLANRLKGQAEGFLEMLGLIHGVMPEDVSYMASQPRKA